MNVDERRLDAGFSAAVGNAASSSSLSLLTDALASESVNSMMCDSSWWTCSPSAMLRSGCGVGAGWKVEWLGRRLGLGVCRTEGR